MEFSEPRASSYAPRARGASAKPSAYRCTSYYSRGCDCAELYQDLKIAKDPSFERYLNSCDVICWDTFSLMFRIEDKTDPVTLTNRELCADLKEEFAEIRDAPCNDLPTLLCKLYKKTGRRFIFIIDSWDAIFRERKQETQLQNRYLDFLHALFCGEHSDDTVAGVYMTGVLPISMYDSQELLGGFQQFTMSSPGELGKFIGYTADEVAALCSERGMDTQKMRFWYDGYRFADVGHIFCPHSVSNAIFFEDFRRYWTQTENYTALFDLIDLGFSGLHNAVAELTAGGTCRIEPDKLDTKFLSLHSKDDVLLLLVHYGYLGYDRERHGVFIPNEEIRGQFAYYLNTYSHSDERKISL